MSLLSWSGYISVVVLYLAYVVGQFGSDVPMEMDAVSIHSQNPHSRHEFVAVLQFS